MIVLLKWVGEQASDPMQAFPGKGQMKPEQSEIDLLRKAVVRLKEKHDILKKQRPGAYIIAPLRASILPPEPPQYCIELLVRIS